MSWWFAVLAELVIAGTPFRFCRDTDRHTIARRLWGLEEPPDHPGGTHASPLWDSETRTRASRR